MGVRPITVGLALLALGLAPAMASAAGPQPGVYMLDEDFAGADGSAAAVAASAAGATEIRKDFLWRSIEPEPGRFDWTGTDRAMAGTAAAGLTLVPTLVTTPAWATAQPGVLIPGVFPPADPGTYAAFAAAVAARYGPGGTFWAARPDLPVRPVRTWQIWNEPNLPAFWRPGPDPHAYAELLKAAAAAIRGVDAGAEIVMAGLPESLGGEPPKTFLMGVYAAGGASAFDTLAVHPYAPDAASMVAAAVRVRSVADVFGDSETPLRVTEFGWASEGDESLFTSDEPTQAALVGDGIVALRAAAARLRLKGFVYFKWRDHPRPAAARNIWPYHAGLKRQDDSSKPALHAFTRALTAPLPDPEPPARPPTQTGHGDRAEPRATPLRVRARVPSRQRAGHVTRRGLKVRGGCSRACTVSVTVSLERPIGGRRLRTVVARASRRLPDPRARTLALDVPAQAVRRAKSRTARLVVRVSATSGGDAAMSVPVHLRYTRDGFGR